jgi:rhamnopyranosyl-N-acetylglucosaminyl-diphospho-decaprenol beta-1,3/1,4-galactofuranosyltransferase
MQSIVAVIVTYNRLKLLQEAVASVKNQSYPIERILVVDNGSTDGTSEWLAQQDGLTIEHIKDNCGASGGFYAGLKRAVSFNSDWLWVMDDDAICQSDSLEKLAEKTSIVSEPIGFVGSKCIWTDGKPNYMSVPNIKPSFQGRIPFNKYDSNGLLLIESSSWVSILINTEAVKDVGLPYKEFFFWSDDLEYTQRLTKAGYLGFYCTDSVVVHKTAINYCSDFCSETVPNLWKHRYGFRNEFFLMKKKRGFTFYFFWLFAKVGYIIYKLLRTRKDNHLKFIGVLFDSAWQSLFFNPKIDKV